MMEAGAVIAKDGSVIHWHLPPGRTGGSLPDSSELWNVLWESRNDVLGFAHSHPGGGVPGPSYTDLTTFAAIETALGRRLNWWITSSESLIVLSWVGPDRLFYGGDVLTVEPPWANRLRELSLDNSPLVEDKG